MSTSALSSHVSRGQTKAAIGRPSMFHQMAGASPSSNNFAPQQRTYARSKRGKASRGAAMQAKATELHSAQTVAYDARRNVRSEAINDGRLNKNMPQLAKLHSKPNARRNGGERFELQQQQHAAPGDSIDNSSESRSETMGAATKVEVAKRNSLWTTATATTSTTCVPVNSRHRERLHIGDDAAGDHPVEVSDCADNVEAVETPPAPARKPAWQKAPQPSKSSTKGKQRAAAKGSLDAHVKPGVSIVRADDLQPRATEHKLKYERAVLGSIVSRTSKSHGGELTLKSDEMGFFVELNGCNVHCRVLYNSIKWIRMFDRNLLFVCLHSTFNYMRGKVPPTSFKAGANAKELSQLYFALPDSAQQRSFSRAVTDFKNLCYLVDEGKKQSSDVSQYVSFGEQLTIDRPHRAPRTQFDYSSARGGPRTRLSTGAPMRQTLVGAAAAAESAAAAAGGTIEIADGGAGEHMVTYAPAGKGGVDLSTADVALLGKDQWLNDSLIDFYLLYLMNERVPADKRGQFHVFGSLFYSQLEQYHTRLGEKDINKRMQGWAKSADLLLKNYVLIPYSKHSHWRLLVVCHLPALIASLAGTFQSSSSSSSPSSSSASAAASAASSSSEEESAAAKKKKKQSASTSGARPVFNLSKGGSASGGPVTRDRGVATTKPAVALMFDSMPGREASVIKWFGKFLLHVVYPLACEQGAVEPMPAKEVEAGLTSIPCRKVDTPQQDNSSDCGVFLLEFCERFCQQPPTLDDMRKKGPKSLFGGRRWFDAGEVIPKKRKEIRALILRLRDEKKVADELAGEKKKKKKKKKKKGGEEKEEEEKEEEEKEEKEEEEEEEKAVAENETVDAPAVPVARSRKKKARTQSKTPVVSSGGTTSRKRSGSVAASPKVSKRARRESSKSGVIAIDDDEDDDEEEEEDDVSMSLGSRS